jgi:hypothetical protein
MEEGYQKGIILLNKKRPLSQVMKAASSLCCRAVLGSDFAGIKTTQLIMLLCVLQRPEPFAHLPDFKTEARPRIFPYFLSTFFGCFAFMSLAFWSCLLAACFLLLSLSFLPPLSPIACSFRRAAF